MAPSIGVNLRVTGHCNQGGRRYMEDAFAVAYQQTDDERDLEYAYFGIFDGHGGRDAALFAKEHLMNFIVSQKSFWSDSDEEVLKSIKDGFVATHMAMWKQVSKWPQTVSGLPSTSGTTASVIFIRKGKMYVGHVGDSAIVLGYKDPDGKHYGARPLTCDHKPESPAERKRIEDVGGSVVSKCGVQRVVWNRPRIGHKGPVRRSTHIDQIPFLAVARSLGDLWSYDYLHGQFIVSPEPDVHVVTLDPKRDRCIVLATDGVWNMISYKEAVRVVEAAEHENERHFLIDESRQIGCKPWVNPSKLLVDRALDVWMIRKKRADNTSVVTVMLDPPGPPRSEVLLRRRMLQKLRPRDESEVNLQVENDRREQPRVLVTHAPQYDPLESGTCRLSDRCATTATPLLCGPPLPPKTRSFVGSVYPQNHQSSEPDCLMNLRRARTPPVTERHGFSPSSSSHKHPVSLQRTTRCYDAQAMAEKLGVVGEVVSASDAESASSVSYETDREKRDAIGLSSRKILEQQAQQLLSAASEHLKGSVKSSSSKSTVASTTATVALKRKLVHGGRSSIVVKHSRLYRRSGVPSSCLLTNSPAYHITRSRVRLRKAQA